MRTWFSVFIHLIRHRFLLLLIFQKNESNLGRGIPRWMSVIQNQDWKYEWRRQFRQNTFTFQKTRRINKKILLRIRVQNLVRQNIRPVQVPSLQPHDLSVTASLPRNLSFKYIVVHTDEPGPVIIHIVYVDDDVDLTHPVYSIRCLDTQNVLRTLLMIQGSCCRDNASSRM